jgi:hypothetical protein
MRLTLIGAGLMWMGLVTGAHALTATCTVTDASVPVASQDLVGKPENLVGVAIPVELDETSGTFAMDFSAVPDAPFTLIGTDSTLRLAETGKVTGSIDRAGNVVVPAVQVNFTTVVTPIPISAPVVLTTGLAAVTLQARDFPTEGSPLDFTTGTLRVAGQAVLLDAPIVGQVTTGLSLACTLAPIPSRDALPAGPSLTARGTSKSGTTTGAVTGDTLTLKAKIKNGKTPLDPSQDLLVRVGLADTDLLLLWAPAGTLAKKGKKLSASDTDGSTLHLLRGRKQDGDASATVSGSLVLVQSKKGLALTLKESGVDSSALASAPAGTTATVTVGIGSLAASDDVTVKAGAKKTVLK